MLLSPLRRENAPGTWKRRPTAVLVLLFFHLTAPWTADGVSCPLANSVDGLTAAGYSFTESDTGSVHVNGSISLQDITFNSPETTQRRLGSHDWAIAVDVTCASVPDAGCSDANGQQHQYPQCDGLIGGLCYILRNGQTNLEGAQAQCIGLGGHLATNATPAQYTVGASVLSSNGACVKEKTVDVKSAGVAAVNGIYQLANRNSAHSWVHSGFPYYVLAGNPNNAEGLVDLFRSRHENAWRIRKDGEDLYKTTGASIQGPWTAFSTSNNPAPSSSTVWPCPSDFNNNYGSHYFPSKSPSCRRHFGVQCDLWTQEKSKCIGCAGSVGVHVDGVGAYNSSLASTCDTCSCNPAGIPHRPYRNRLPSVWQEPIFDNNQEPQVSYGNWTSFGNCTFDNITGSGQCDCSQRDGTTIVPEGPWYSTGNCSAPIEYIPEDHHIGGTSFRHPDGTLHSGQFCACTNRGEVITPKTTYNSTHDPSLSYSSQWQVLADTSLSYITSYIASVNLSLSYPRTYETVHNASLSYATAWNILHNSSLSYIQSWKSLHNVSLSYATAWDVVHNSSLSYIQTWKSLHNVSLSYATAWDVVHAAKTYNRTWTSGYIAHSYVTAWTSVHNASLSYVVAWRTIHNSSKSFIIQLDSGANMTVTCAAYNCSCSDSGVSSTISPWNKDCGCGCIPATTAPCSALNCSCSTTDTPSGVTAEPVTHSPIGKSCGCKCVEASRATCVATNCSCSTTETENGVTAQAVTHSPIGKSCGCTCTVSSQAYCSAQNCTCTQGVGGGQSSTHSIAWTAGRSYDCGCGCAESQRAYCTAANCSCSTTQTAEGVTAQAVTHSPIGQECGCKCEEASRAHCSMENCSCTQGVGGGQSSTHSIAWTAGRSYDCGCGCAESQRAYCSAANCSCPTSSSLKGVFATSVTHSPIGQSCGCGCVETSRAFCRRENCSCSYSIAAQTANAVNVDTLTHSPFDYDCGCKCSPATYSNCSTQNCSCSTNYFFSPSPVTHSPIGKQCGCACRVKEISNCSSANCTCDPNTGDPITTSPIGQSCGCKCTDHVCGCKCQRRPCSCQCTKTCDCSCKRNACNYTVSEDGKTFNSTGGLNCSVQAYCDSGFYAGGAFTAYKSDGAVVPNVEKDGVLLSSDHLGSTTSSYHKVWNANSGLHRFHKLVVSNSASKTKQYSLYFTTGNSARPRILTSPRTSYFSVYPKSIRVLENQVSNRGHLSSGAYIAGSSLGTYSAHLTDDNNGYITDVEAADGFVLLSYLVTGEGRDSCQFVNFPSSYARLDAADLIVFDLSVSSTQESVSDEINLDSSTNKFRFSFTTANQTGLSYQIVLNLNHPASQDGANLILQARFVPHGYSNTATYPFRIDPFQVVAGFGDSEFFSSHRFPTIVRLDGNEVDGLPSPLKMYLTDTMNRTLHHANCAVSAYVRLAQCSDSMSGKVPYPACESTAQAMCSTSSADGSVCPSASAYNDTLSGTTIQNVANGIATFTNIQVQHVIGAGYRLEFAFNAPAVREEWSTEWATLNYRGSADQCQKCCLDAFTYGPGHACRRGCPWSNCGKLEGSENDVWCNKCRDGEWDSNGAWTSSLGTNWHDRCEYRCDVRNAYNDQIIPNSWFFPCGAQYNGGSRFIDSCSVGQELSSQHGSRGHVTVPNDLYASPGINNSFFIAPYNLSVVQDIGGDGVDVNSDGVPDGVGAGHVFRVQPAIALRGKGYKFRDWGQHGFVPVAVMIENSSCTGNCSSLRLQGTLTPLSSTINSTATQMVYTTTLGEVGMIWRDLKISMKQANAHLSLRLTYRVGPDNKGDTMFSSIITSSMFDVFSPPDPPLNLRVYSYNNLGFRVEFDPASISRARPLSGFIIEAEECSSSNESCAMIASANDLKTYDLARSLGTDYSQGGGHTEEVSLSYSNASAGSASKLSLHLKPSLSIFGGDNIVFDLGFPGVLFHHFDRACVLSGPDGKKFVLSVDTALSRVKLIVKDGFTLFQDVPVIATIPLSCNLLLPGSDALSENVYGKVQKVDRLPRLVIASILGASKSGRFDNCKGRLSCSVATATKFSLPIIQDDNSMDTQWSGNLQQDGVGAACASTLAAASAAGAKFPANRVCSFDSPNSNDPDSSDGSGGNSGDNGHPIGANPGRGSMFTTGTAFNDDDASCRSGTATHNPCALSVGHDWSMGINLKYVRDSQKSTVSAIEIRFSRDRFLQPSDVIEVPCSELILQMCNYTATHLIPTTTSSFSGRITPGKICKLKIVSMHIDGALLANVVDWKMELHIDRKQLNIYVGSPVVRGSKILLKAQGFDADAPTADATWYQHVVARVLTGSRTTVIFKNGGRKISYEPTEGDPVGSYRSSGRLSLTAGSIYRFRVYAYNGRFLSQATSTLVHNRAIVPPQKPAYFPQMSQATIGAKLEYGNILGRQLSAPTLGLARPVLAEASTSTRIGITFTPDRDLVGTISLKLPGFELSDYAVLSNDRDMLLLADEYQVVGNSTACTCGIGGHPPLHPGGTIITPRNLYSVRRSASGSGSCAYTGNGSVPPVPWCACSDGTCTLEGVALTPTTLYNVSNGGDGNCSCACTDSGKPIFPKPTFTVVGNCSSCTCDSDGRSSHTPFVEQGACNNCTCSAAGVNATPAFPGVSCTGCRCASQSCSCSCIPQICNCACPVFRKCDISCDIVERYSCACVQNTSHPSITRASWSAAEESLVLTVDQGKMLKKGMDQTVWISPKAGIKYPKTNLVPLAPDGVSSGVDAKLNEFEVKFVSPFPTSSQPRLGFVIQFTSDLFWKRHIQSVFFRDLLDSGINQLVPISHLVVFLSSTSTKVEIFHSNLKAAIGQVIQVHQEQMLVTGVNESTLLVQRGYAGTLPTDHATVSGDPGCTCHTNGTTSFTCENSNTTCSVASCSCTQINIAFRAGVSQLLDSGKTGYEGSSCRVAVGTDEGCNPSRILFPSQIRTHQSATLSDGSSPSLRIISSCGGTIDSCERGCKCESASHLSGMEFGNLIFGGNVSIVSTGDPMEYPKDLRTRLITEVSRSNALSIIVEDPSLLIGKYIRIDNEFLFVKSQRRGVLSVNTFQAYPRGGSCLCSFSGMASGGDSCTCVGSAGENCTEGGMLSGSGGGGSGFEGTFTTSGGSISNVTVSQPGSYPAAGPTIVISGGGTGCAGYQFYTTMTDNILDVVRGALGSAVTAHENGAKVYTVLWPSQSTPKRPGKRYNFRIAAYNAAGLSDWLYYDLKLYNVFPRRLSAKGNIPMEIVLIGGGTSQGAANYSVYIGHTRTDNGQIDWSRSKACTSLMVLDEAGTKISVRSPAWVGKAHDLIVHYQSGIFEQFAVGANWIEYEAPAITSVMPALLDGGFAANVTVLGQNFGSNSSDVSGHLEGTSVIPCTPFTLVNDGQGICTLIPGKNDVLMGFIIVTVGSEWSGGSQKSTTSASSFIKEKPTPVQIESSLPIDITVIPEGSPEREALTTSFKADVSSALGVPSWRISIQEIKAGSIIIVFVILPDTSSASSPSPALLAANLAAQAADPNSALRQTSTGNSITVSVPSNINSILAAESAQLFTSLSTSSSTKKKKKIALDIDYRDPNFFTRWEKWQKTAHLH